MVLFMMKSHLYNLRIDTQPALLKVEFWNGVSIETPETHLDLPLCTA